MKLVIISDTHNLHKQLTLPLGDVLIHCGDATLRGSLEEFAAFGNWFVRQPHRYKIYVPGNHDFICDKFPDLARELLGVHYYRNVHMLVDRPLIIDGVKFYGTPWVPNLEGWAFYGDHITLCSRFGRIPNDTDVLITHGPPQHILDVGSHHFGSVVLLQRVSELAHTLKVHCFGHIHESYGVLQENGTKFVNAAICDIDYDAVNAPIEVDLDTSAGGGV